VTIKDTALKSITRQKTVPPTWLAADLTRACLELVRACWPKGKPIRLLTVTAQNLLPAGQAVEQLSLFDAPGGSERIEQLEKAVDGIHERYGGDSIRHGSTLGSGIFTQ
jgi:DNA polymerase-4